MRYIPWIIAALLGFGLLAANVWGRGTPHVGSINVGVVIDESPRAQELNKQLAAEYETLVARLQAGDDLDEEQREEREREVYVEYLRIRQELEDTFQRELDRAVERVAKEKGLDIVIDDDVVRLGGVDISQDVARILQ